MTLKNHKLSLAIIAAMSSVVISACGGGGGSGGSSTPEASGPYKNNTICYGNADTDEKVNKCNLRIYQVMVESFQDGDSSIGYGTGYGPSKHQGDIKGIINAIPYIKSLGMNAIWLTPIFDSSSCGHTTEDPKLDATGYYACDYTNIDPKFGTKEDLKNLVNKAHENGLYVFLDGVFGHFKQNNKNAEWMDVFSGQKIHFTNTCRTMDGKTNDLKNPLVCADFSNQTTLEGIKSVASHYIKEYNIDGWRLDQAYQLTPDQWREVVKVVNDASLSTTYKLADKTVNPLGYMVGEVWGWTNSINSAYDGSDGKDAALESIFDFPLRYRITQTLAQNEKGDDLKNSGIHIKEGFTQANSYPKTAMPNYFITNHDVVRFANLIKRAKANKLSWVENESLFNRETAALSLLAIASGPITNYYGEERGQIISNYLKDGDNGWYDDNASRDDGVIDSDPSITPINDDIAPNAKEMRKYFTQLMTLRANANELSMGKMQELETTGKIFGINKTLKNNTIVYYLNVNENESVDVSIPKDKVGADVEYLINPFTGDKISLNNDNFEFTLNPLQHVFLIPNTNDVLDKDIFNTDNIINFEYY
ncbi:MAG: alpha-amylase family glycosyl hydrolase [Succinivibrionaceae bacterium]